jgi:protein-S-isoprenylcysteine O-methyltransferase Ste14
MSPPLLLHDHAAAVAFYASVLSAPVVEGAARVRARAPALGDTSRTSRTSRTSQDWSMFFILAAIAASVSGGYVIMRLQITPFPGADVLWPLVVGLAMMWIGVALRVWAVLTLGRFFKLVVVVQDDHHVIDHGPYRWLRHPSYLGVIIALCGIGVAEGTWLGVAVMLLLPLAAFVVRIRVEERALLQALGEDYAAYAHQTARLIPGLY